jgi:hypothetical protein
MRMHYVQHLLTATLPTLLLITYPFAATGRADEAAAAFSAAVQFELGEAEFAPGDSITIQQVRGTSSTIRTGETYCVEGTYTLASRAKAELALFATTRTAVSVPTDPSQIMRIEKGTGAFRLVKTMREEGYLHVSFYPAPSGSAFGGVYFGQGQWVLKNKGWSYLDRHTTSPDFTTKGASTGPPGSLNGPNQAMYEYLGDPVEPPADMDTAYSKDGLIKTIQAAAQKAGISVKRVEIEDSEFPFLVGLICQKGDFAKLTEQLRKMAAYEYHGCISSSTHSAFNMVPYRAFPPRATERIGHRTGLRNQMFFDRLQRLE